MADLVFSRRPNISNFENWTKYELTYTNEVTSIIAIGTTAVATGLEAVTATTLPHNKEEK